MKKKIIIAAAAVLATVSAAALGFYFYSPSYSGSVIEKGSNKPISGISVTDGRNVVKTDDEGKFLLKGYRKTRFISLTLTSDYTADSFYIRKDKGIKEYNFELEKKERLSSDEHSFLAIADSEIGEKGVGDWINHIKSLVEETKPEFLIHLGDICYEDGLREHIKGMNSQNMGVPVHYIMGNHDYVKGKYGEEMFESIYGPVWYSFEHENVHYVVTPFQNGADYRSGYDSKDRWKWLENDLKNTDPDMKVVMFNHEIAPNDDYVLDLGANKNLDLKEHNLIAWLFGHYHTNFIKENDGILNIGTARPDAGGIDQSLSGTRQISIDKDGNVKSTLHYYDYTHQTKGLSIAKWSAKLEGNIAFSDPLVVGDRVFAATMSDNYPIDCSIYALDINDGSIVWEFKTKNSILNRLQHFDGNIYAQDMEGRVYCLDEKDGKEIWTKELFKEGVQNTLSGILVSDDVVYAGKASNVFALNAKTGEEIWNAKNGRGEPSASKFILVSDVLVVGAHWNALIGIDINTGKQIWDNKDEKIRFRSSSPEMVDENTIIVADDNAVMLVDVKTGEIKNKTIFEGYNFSSSAKPVIKNGIAYIPTANKGMFAYSIDDDKMLWNTNTRSALIFTAPYVGKGAESIESSPILIDDKLIFGASDGYVYVLNAKDGKILKEVFLSSPVFSGIALANDLIIAADFSGYVSMLDIS